MLSHRFRFAVCAALAPMFAFCKDRPKPQPAQGLAENKQDAAAAAVDASARSGEPEIDASASSTDAGSRTAALPADAGANACRLLYGPVQQPFTGPAALIATDAGLDVVWHRNGAARVISVPVPPVPAVATAKPVRKLLDRDAERASRPACAAAGPYAFCADAQGQVHRVVRAQPEIDAVVAHADMGAVVTAAMLGDQPVLGYLAVRTTSEGRTSEAYARLGDEPPLRISESGNGATDVVFAPRGREGVLAMTIDARRAMSPVHARALTSAGGKLTMSPDVVIYIGGGSEHQVRGALGIGGRDAFGLMPTSVETGFGLAIVRIDAPPRLDEPSQVSLYPNGFDFAAVAASQSSSSSSASQAESPIYVARVRPIAAEPSAMRMLELGKIDAKDGSFLPFGFVPSSSSIQNVAIVRDRFGAIWVEYTDGGGSWLERRLCP